jgi:glutathione S-transferase
MIVYGTSLSPFVRKTLTFIGEKGLAAEHVPVRPHDALPAFATASPLGKIPGFADGDHKLADSSAICHYLERKSPTPALFPVEPRSGRAHGVVRGVRRHRAESDRRQGVLPAQGQADAAQGAARHGDRRPGAEQGDAAAAGLSRKADFRTVSGGWQAQPRRHRDPFVFVNLKLAGHPLDATRWPKLGGYIASLLARPAFAPDPKPVA